MTNIIIFKSCIGNNLLSFGFQVICTELCIFPVAYKKQNNKEALICSCSVTYFQYSGITFKATF